MGLLLLLFCNGCAQTTRQDIPLDTKIGQMIMVGFRGSKAGPKSHIAQIIRKYKIGGVFLFDYDVPRKSNDRNIHSPRQLKSLTRQLQKQSNIPLLIGIDQEGGMVSRLKPARGFPSSVSEQYLGAMNNLDSTRFYARRAAKELKNAGINLNLAPVVDLNINPQNPVIGSLKRSYSANPAIVTRNAEAYINELHRQGILTAIKHFPGHGSSKKDSHKGVVDVTHTWERQELIPYRKLIKAKDVDIIMTAHIFNARLDSTYPATLSRTVIHGLLRDSLGYGGVVMSDDMQMGAIRKEYGLKKAIKKAIQAGDDIISFANNSVFDPDIAAKAHQIIKQLVEKGVISRERIDASYRRIMKLKQGI